MKYGHLTLNKYISLMDPLWQLQILQFDIPVFHCRICCVVLYLVFIML